ncbi:MAG: hypothetical protein LBD48_05950 [Treponema sp.]|nr:hypothetical protein [Treponema sp.]
MNNRFGEMIEYLAVPCLIGQFRKLGFTFTTARQKTVIEDPGHDFYTEIDVFLENGDKALLVEIKSKPSI